MMLIARLCRMNRGASGSYRVFLTKLFITIVCFVVQATVAHANADADADADADALVHETSSTEQEETTIDNEGMVRSSGISALGRKDCADKFVVSTDFHTAKITRSRAGMINGRQAIRYHLHFQTKYPNQTVTTLMEPFYNNPYAEGKFTREPPQQKNNYYYHINRWVTAGGVVGFDAIADFEPPVGGRVEGTSQFYFSCTAR